MELLKNWILDSQYGGAGIFPSGHSGYCSKKKTAHKAFFPIHCNPKIKASETNEGTPVTLYVIHIKSFYSDSAV